MASNTWPSDLPDKPLREGYQETPPQTQIRTEMDTGPDKVRQRFTANVREYNVQIIIDNSQLDSFDTFYTDTTSGGAEKFDYDNPRSGTTEEFRFVVPPDPQYEALGGDLYRVSFKLEQLP